MTQSTTNTPCVTPTAHIQGPESPASPPASTATPATTPTAAPTALDVALSLVAVGYWVFPTTVTYRPDGKKDVQPHAAWKTIAAGPVPSEGLIRTWWAQHPGAWPTLITGKNGLVTVDCDVPHAPGEPDGREEWLAATSGLLPEHTLSTTTGGLHHMYRCATPVRNSVKDVAPGVDVRGEMGAQFIHPCAWEAAVCLPEVSALSPLPQVVIDHERARDTHQAAVGAIPAPRSYAPASGTGGDVGRERRFTTEQAKKFIQNGVAAQLDGAKPGDMNARINKAAVVCGHFVPSLLSYDNATQAVWDVVCQVRAANGQGPDTSDWKTIHSGLGFGMSDPFVIDDSSDSGETPNLPAHSLALPDVVWRASDVLSALRGDALSRGATPDAVLLGVLTRLSAVVHHRTRVEGDAGPASLNLFGVAVGRAGTGKSTAIELAREILPFPSECPDTSDDSVSPWIDELSMSTGQGISATYYGTREDTSVDPSGKPHKAKSQGFLRHNAMFTLDEGAVAVANTTTEGSNLTQVLCAAWKAERNGQANAATDRRRALPADSYAMGLYMGMQPGLMGPFLSDTISGLAQRMLFAWAEPDPTGVEDAKAARRARVSARRKGRTGARASTPPGVAATLAWTYHSRAAGERGRTILLPEELALQLADEAVEVQHGLRERPAHRTHDGLKRLKVAALLMLLHSAAEVTDDLGGPDNYSSWDLAGLIVDQSDVVRTHCLNLAAQVQQTQRAQRAEADRAKGRAIREGQHEADAVSESARAAQVESLARRVVAYLGRTEKPIGVARVRSDLKPGSASTWDAALAHAIDHEWVVTEPGRKAGSTVLKLGSETPDET